MNPCAQFEEQVIAAAAGDLGSDEAPALDRHLAACSACRERLAQERVLFNKIDAGLAARVASEPSPAFAQCVMEQVSGAGERKLFAAIDAGLAQTVAGDPSPAFAATVRMRVASEPPPKRAWFSFGAWVPIAGPVAAAALLVLFFWNWPAPPRPGIPTLPVEAAKRGPAPSVAAVNPAGVSQGQIQTTRVHAKRQGAAKSSEYLEVLISAEERRVVVGFYRFVQEGRINPEQVLAANRAELVAKLNELQTPILALKGSEVKTLDLVDTVRSTSDDK